MGKRGSYRKKPAIDRFMSFVSPEPTSGCWLWTGCYDPLGYGRFSFNRKSEKANRVAWKLLVGTDPGGLFVCHKCDNPGCVNPDHLFLGTVVDNTRDMDAKGRRVNAQLAGDDHPRAKLTRDAVLDIRRRVAGGETMLGLSKQYGVSFTAVWSAVRGHTWRHI